MIQEEVLQCQIYKIIKHSDKIEAYFWILKDIF